MAHSTRTQLLDRITAWANDQPGIRALALLGSSARLDHPADEWSDLDLLLVTADLEAMVASTGWLRQFGEIWFRFTERWDNGKVINQRVLYAGGHDVDFMTLSVETASQGFAGTFIPETAARGWRPLLDKDGCLDTLPAAIPARPNPLPTAQEFTEAVNDFWFHTLWTAKKLRRGELWVAKVCCDDYLKRLFLLSMLAWHAQTSGESNVDTWFNGRFLEQWASPAALEKLRQTFAHYDAQDVWRALQATMDLFDQLARETAARLGYTYPAENVAKVSALIRTLAPTDLS